MKPITYNETHEVDIDPFCDLIGKDVAQFIFAQSPRKVRNRVSRALEHYVRSEKLIGIDEEMGAIRLIAGEEELVVAIFECLKLRGDLFPEHKDFVRKFKNHVVKLSFYPVLQQFRFIVGDMMNGFTIDGLEDVVNWTARPEVDKDMIKLALLDNDGREIIRHDPFAIDISRGDQHGKNVVPDLLADLRETIRDQQGVGLKEYVLHRADFRNHLLYATDGGSALLGNSLADLRKTFGENYHDLLWVLALVIGGRPPSKEWGIASQFIEVYRLTLIEAGILRANNDPVDEAQLFTEDRKTADETNRAAR